MIVILVFCYFVYFFLIFIVVGIKCGWEFNFFDNWEDIERVCKLVCFVDVRVDDIEVEFKVGNNVL